MTIGSVYYDEMKGVLFFVFFTIKRIIGELLASNS